MAISVTADTVNDLRERHAEVFRPPFLRRYGLFMALAFCVLYSFYCWWFFGVGKALERANWGIAGSYLADWVSYEVRPDVEFEDGYLQIVYPRFSPLGDNPDPEWIVTKIAPVTIREQAAAKPATGASKGANIFMNPDANTPAVTGNGSQNGAATPSDASKKPAISFMAPSSSATQLGGANTTTSQTTATRTEDKIVEADVLVGDARIEVRQGIVTVIRGGQSWRFDIEREEKVIPLDGLAEWMSQRRPGEKVRLNFGWSGRAEVQDDEVKVWHRFFGWENFFFDTNSKLWPLSGGERMVAIFGGDRLDPKMSNAALAWRDFTMNPSWQHWDVWVKLLQTIVMAFVGTLFATLLAFPLAFMAARNITRSTVTNQITKRFFDFFRSVDMLIWALFFTRAFGPGPLAGISAIFVTDTGTLGKLYAEALENIDDKQREGVKSVGATGTLIQRFGVVPQVLPVFMSQSLYFWESNTRSATIIGAVGAGGIGLKLWEAMRTNQDWENVAYMVILILIVVFIFDNISNYLRSKLTGAGKAP
ncbi:MAG: phosphonate ABC transporter, permease protein PhnE [Pseudomonadota bacterium]